MKRLASLALGVLFAAACGGSDSAQLVVQDSLGRDLSLAPVDSAAALNDAPAEAESPAPPPAAPSRPAPASSPRPTPPPATPPAATPAPAPAPAPAAAPRTLGVGTSLTLSMAEAFSTQTHKAGETVTATVPADVKDTQGRTVIPAGAVVTLAIVELEVSENKSDEGKLKLRATKVAFGGESYSLAGVSSSVEHELKGRGVKAGDAAKVGAGAAAGAVVGRVLSGKKKGAVVGGVIGAAAGAAAAANTYDRDVVVAAGAKVVIELTSALEVGA